MEVKTIGEIAKIKTGKYDANHNNPNGDYKFFTCALVPLKADTYSFEGELVILPGNGVNVGEVLYYNGKIEAYQRTYVLHDLNCSGKYLYYYLKNRWKKYNFNRQIGSATNYIKLGDISGFPVPIPPLHLQNWIVQVFDKMQDLIEKRKKQLEKMDELLNNLFIEMFGDPIRNPKGWETEKGLKLFKFASGKFNPTKNLNPDFEYPAYGGNGITGYSREYLIDFNTIVIGRVGVYCGSIHLTKGKCWVTDNAIYIQDYKKDYNNDFLYFLFKYLNLNRFADFSGQPKITQKPLNDLNYILPPIELQNKFGHLTEKIREQERSYARSLSQLENLSESLTQKAFNGEAFR